MKKKKYVPPHIIDETVSVINAAAYACEAGAGAEYACSDGASAITHCNYGNAAGYCSPGGGAS